MSDLSRLSASIKSTLSFMHDELGTQWGDAHKDSKDDKLSLRDFIDRHAKKPEAKLRIYQILGRPEEYSPDAIERHRLLVESEQQLAHDRKMARKAKHRQTGYRPLIIAVIALWAYAIAAMFVGWEVLAPLLLGLIPTIAFFVITGIHHLSSEDTNEQAITRPDYL